MVGVADQGRRELSRNERTLGIGDVGESPLILQHECGGVASVPEGLAHLVVDMVGSERAAREVARHVDSLPLERKAQTEVQVGQHAFGVADGTFVHVVDESVAVKILVADVPGTQRGVVLAVDIDRVIADLLPRAELSVGFVSPRDVAVTLPSGVDVFVPGVFELGIVLMVGQVARVGEVHAD